MGGQGRLTSAVLSHTSYRTGARLREATSQPPWHHVPVAEQESGPPGENVLASESREWGLPRAGPEVATAEPGMGRRLLLAKRRHRMAQVHCGPRRAGRLRNLPLVTGACVQV